MKNQKGYSLIEAVITVTVLAIVFLCAQKAMAHVHASLFLQAKLSQVLELDAVNHEIGQQIRNARRLAAIEPDRLEIEVYNFRQYPLPDRRGIEAPLLVRYQYVPAPAGPAIENVIYESTQPAAAVLSRRILLRSLPLCVPDVGHPYFEPRYEVGASTSGVAVTFRLFSPFFRQEVVPVPVEATVYGKGV